MALALRCAGLWQAVVAGGPAFAAHRTRACRKFGVLTEYLRTRPGAYRSDHPDGSMAAVGKLGAWLTANHPLSHGMGEASPLAKLVQADGKVLLLGSPLENTTLLHLAEYRAKLPNKRVVRYQTPVYRNGARTLVEIEELDSDGGVVEWTEDGDYFERIIRAFLDSGKGRSGLVGYAESHLMDAAELVSFGVKWMEAHLVAG